MSLKRVLLISLTAVPAFFVWWETLLQFSGAMWPRLLNMLRHGPVVITPPCATPDCDFSVFWPAGLLARMGNYIGVYDPDLFLGLRRQALLAGIQRLDWFYPPPSLIPVMVISHLPFNIAFFVWIFVFFAGAVLILRWAGLSWAVIAAGLLSPAALWSMEMGQFEMLSNAFLVAGLLMVDRTAGRAGILFGLLVIKPQTGLLAPVGLLAARKWRALASGAVVVAVILAGTTWFLGWNVWQAYIQDGLAASRFTLTANTVGFERGVSVFWMVRSFGGSLTQCYVAQGAASLLAVCLAFRLWLWRDLTPLNRMAMTVFLSLMMTPFGYIDDMVAYSIALVALAQARAWRIDLRDGLFFLWPALCPIVELKTGILLTPLIVVWALGQTWWRAAR